MNRRSFFKSVSLTLAAIPFLGFTRYAKQLELDDLYRYVESKTVNHPIHGQIPYKLLPYQREILKAIHENDNLIIVKGRQIGMTTMLAAYASWLSHRRPIWHYYGGCNRWCDRDYNQLIQRFDPAEFDMKSGAFQLCFHDERHYHCRSMGIPTHPNRKNVVCGTIDKEGVLKKFIDHSAQSDWKVLYYPVSKCRGAWDSGRIARVRPYSTNREWAREMECQFT